MTLAQFGIVCWLLLFTVLATVQHNRRSRKYYARLRPRRPGTPNASVRCGVCKNVGTNMRDGTVVLFHREGCPE